MLASAHPPPAEPGSYRKDDEFFEIDAAEERAVKEAPTREFTRARDDGREHDARPSDAPAHAATGSLAADLEHIGTAGGPSRENDAASSRPANAGDLDA